MKLLPQPEALRQATCSWSDLLEPGGAQPVRLGRPWGIGGDGVLPSSGRQSGGLPGIALSDDPPAEERDELFMDEPFSALDVPNPQKLTREDR